MHRRLLLALLLALLLEPAAAVSPMDTFYPDPDGILAGLRDACDLCSIYYCVHTLTTSAPAFTVETFTQHPEWPCESLPVFEPSPEPEAVSHWQAVPMDCPADGLPLHNSVIEQLESNATGVLPGTVQAHVEDTYLPGDRLAAQVQRRRPPQRRQAPRRDGYPCTFEGCGKAFDRSCDLNRHQKTHLRKSERPYKCSICDDRFLYPKDRARHQLTHTQSPSSQAILHCRSPGCTKNFSRRDNLLRHQRNQHPHMIATN